MENVPAPVWIAACAHRLQQRWRTVPPVDLEEAAWDLWRDERLREMGPQKAAETWLQPVGATSDHGAA